MGDYNPDAGLIVGQEWVPIANETYILDANKELGFSFRNPSTQVFADGRIFFNQPAVNAFGGDLAPFYTPINNIYVMMNVYPTGQEANTGPMRQVIVPVSGGAITGTDLALGGGGSPATVQQALYRQGDSAYITCIPTALGNVNEIYMNFAIDNYAPELTGKRIVKMELLYQINTFDSNFFQSGYIDVRHNFNSGGSASAEVCLASGADFASRDGSNFDTVPAMTLPNFNTLWGLPADYAFVFPSAAFPWTYNRLYLLSTTATADPAWQTFGLRILSGAVGTYFQIEYAALRITYCEEQRVAAGGECLYIFPQSSPFGIRSISNISTPNNAIVPAGDYTMTVEGGELNTGLYATRELYSMEAQKGVEVIKTDRIGETFEANQTDLMLELTMIDAAANINTGVHPYALQISGDSYQWPDNLQTRQRVVNNSLGGTLNYPWARFYARRFGDTSAPLSLTATANTAITQSISVADFDALPEIQDGWKKVDLYFNAPVPTFDNSQTNTIYFWSSGAEIGSGWEVMGALARITTGTIPEGFLTGTNSPALATYGNTSAFMTIQGVGGIEKDAVIMFAQDMPAVSGFALSPATLAVSGIGEECGVPPECIPSGISYTELTWTPLGPSSMPATGFGFYEVQRSDDVDTEWTTILVASSPLVSGFADFEARVGVPTYYRIRFQHRLEFPGPWSSTLTTTIAAPGVTGTSVSNGVLIFTTNERQTGNSSLAYAMQWENKVEESFTFIEAGQVQIQTMYDRDYQVAFRPLERGGERFSRNMLVQAAAVPDGLMQYGFTSLRDLAWEQVSYVCVRDELGDRWLATVIVPDGVVERDRRLYMASIDVIEVTATPSIVYLPSETQGGGGSGSSCTPALWDGIPGWDYGCWSA